MTASIPILMYHQISPECHPSFRKYTISPSVFRTQVRWLKLLGYEAIGIDDLLAQRAGARALPRRPILITFDDGFLDCYRYAAPVLAAAGYTGVFYLVAGLMGKSSEWLHERGISVAMMDWTAARELETAGFRCGAHTVRHARLTELPDDLCRGEIETCRRMLEDRLGRGVYDLAYPFGACDARVRRAAADAGCRSACTVRIGLSGAGDDALMLPRVPINGNESFPDFVCRLRTAQSARSLVGERVRSVRRLFSWEAG